MSQSGIEGRIIFDKTGVPIGVSVQNGSLDYEAQDTPIDSEPILIIRPPQKNENKNDEQ
jgi:hypothetical protein